MDDNELLMPEDLGCTTWMEVYEDLVKEKLHLQESVEYQFDPHDYPGSQVTVQVAYIESMAFREIYPLLPPKKAMDVMIDTAKDIGGQAQIFTRFLDKIPTRLHD